PSTPLPTPLSRCPPFQTRSRGTGLSSQREPEPGPSRGRRSRGGRRRGVQRPRRTSGGGRRGLQATVSIRGRRRKRRAEDRAEPQDVSRGPRERVRLGAAPPPLAGKLGGGGI